MELVIDKPELQILLNLLPDDTLVSYPLYGNFSLLKFRRKGYGHEIEALANPEAFSEILSEKKILSMICQITEISMSVS